MTLGKGKIVLMGSGELTATMVEVHKELLKTLGKSPHAAFIDTPAGFQLNVDQLSQRALEYFNSRVQHNMSVVSFKSNETITPFEAEQAFHSLRETDYILIGPGSPTYAVRQWKQTPIPDILAKRVVEGACLVAASAAALTVGRFTLPVYEIYKVGEQLHWIEGMDILGKFGLDFVVIPHWNNAEGGNHDTRFCYMGEPRFNQLSSNLPDDVSILGLDEHTACIIDFAAEEIMIKGIGSVTLRRQGIESTFSKGGPYPLGVLLGENAGNEVPLSTSEHLQHPPAKNTEIKDNSFWKKIHSIQANFQNSLDENDSGGATNALLELDGTIWKEQQELENPEFISQARDILRDMIVLFGTCLSDTSRNKPTTLGPMVERLINIRNHFRKTKKWAEADAIRDCLLHSNIVIEDTDDGTRWHPKE
jgi:peptidase E